MTEGLIPRRYAKALHMLAVEKGVDSDVYAAMRTLCAAFEARPDLQKALANPHVDESQKKLLLIAAANPKTSLVRLLSDMADLLLQNRRMNLAREVAQAYVAIYREAHSIYSVGITSAVPLQDAELQRIKALVERTLPSGSTAEYAEAVNPDLIGGFTVSIDNQLLDASVSNELKQIRLKLLSHN